VITITLSDQGTTAELDRIAGQLRNPNALLKAVGRRGAEELRKHFRNRNQQGNKLGGRRSNFWRQVADSTNNPVQEGTSRVRISISHPAFAQKVFGGTIKAKNAGALTIPVDPLAYDRTVAVFQQQTGIQLFRLRKKGGGFSNLLAGFISEKVLRVFYVLAKSVTQAADPEALPDRAQFNAAILETATDQIAIDTLQSRS
jgi:hypothetical protein